MKSIVLLISFALPWFHLTDDQLVSKLQKKTTPNPIKNIQRAERMKRKYPKSSVPLYFLVEANISLVDSDSKSLTSYRYLSKALSYGKTFDRKSSQLLKNQLKWDEMKEEIRGTCIGYINALDPIKNKNRIDILTRRINEWLQVEADIAIPSVATTVVKNHSPTFKFNGMPSGLESIESANHQMEEEFVSLLNAARKSKGLEPVSIQMDMTRAARYHASDMANQNYFNHDSYDRLNDKLVKIGTTFERIRTFYSTTFVNGENIAAGSESATGTYHQWFISAGHNKVMFSPTISKVGIGVAYNDQSAYKYYWVLCTAR